MVVDHEKDEKGKRRSRDSNLIVGWETYPHLHYAITPLQNKNVGNYKILVKMYKLLHIHMLVGPSQLSLTT